MKLKFKKKAPTSISKVRWDSQMLGNKFYRIVVNNYGHYVAYFCEGLRENGITPLKPMEHILHSKKYEDCKNKAQEHADAQISKRQEPTPSYAYQTAGCLEGYRSPCKDD